MTPQAWQVLSWALGAGVTVLLFALNRMLGKLDAAAAENKALTQANISLQIALSELKGTATTLERTLSSLPTAVRQEGSSP